MTEQTNPQGPRIPAFDVPEEVTLRLTVLAAVADYARPMGAYGVRIGVVDAGVALVLADWALKGQPSTRSTLERLLRQVPLKRPEPAPESAPQGEPVDATAAEVNAMLREAAATPAEPRSFQVDDVVTINPDAIDSSGDAPEETEGEWIIQGHNTDGAVVDEDGDLHLDREGRMGHLCVYVLPKHVTLVSPLKVPAPEPEPEPEPRAWQVGDVVQVAGDATFLPADSRSGAAGRQVVVSVARTASGNVGLGEHADDPNWSAAPRFLTLVTPAPEEPDNDEEAGARQAAGEAAAAVES